jgi:DNA-binding GntR family transcriptional regulator
MTRSPNLGITVSPADFDTHGGVPAAVAARLREAIISGELPAGTLLRQEEIGQLFRVGRPPVREALTLLDAEGLVVSRPRRGFAVAPLDPADVEEIFDIRMLLEERAAYFAAQRRTLEDVAAMEKLILTMEQSRISNSSEAVAFSLINREFHDLIHKVSSRPVTASVMLGLRNKVERYVRLGGLIAGNMEQVNRDHRMIFEAFRDADAERMAALCREHIRSTGKRLVAALSTNQSTLENKTLDEAVREAAVLVSANEVSEPT